jgi:hypothetical protein
MHAANGDWRMDEATFQINTVSRATGIKIDTLKSWFTRGYVRLGMNDTAAPGLGLARLFSRRTVYLLSVVGRLNAGGMSPALALQHATRVTDRGLQGRNERCLFPSGNSFLLIDPVTSRSEVKRVDKRTGLFEVFEPFDGEGNDSLISINLNSLFQRVDAVLDAAESDQEEGSPS